MPQQSTSQSAPSAGSASAAREAYSSASNTLRTFLQAFPDQAKSRPDRVSPDAIEAIDFSGSLSLLGIPERRSVAYDLRSVIDRLRYIDYAEIDAEVGDASTFLVARTENGSIRLQKQADGEWLFTAKTVEDLPRMLDDVADKANVSGTEADLSRSPRQLVRTYMPPSLRQEYFLLEIWQWLGIVLVILLGLIADRLVGWAGASITRRLLRRFGIELDRREHRADLRPIGLVAMAMVWHTGLMVLLLPATALGILTLAVRVFGCLSFVWAASKMVDLIVKVLSARAAATTNRFDDLLVPFVGRIAKIFIVAFSLVFVAQNMGLNITSLLAGLGLGGLAFALAAKDTVENLFGSLTVLLDHPFRVGDWVALPGTDVEGTVESVGLRSTRIRTFYDSMITVPNATLIRSNVDNYGERRYRRWKTKLGVQYDTPPEKIDAFCEAIRELVRLHPYTRKDYYHIYANEFGDSSLDILLYVFFETPDWSTELRERHRLFVDIVRVAKVIGVEFAFPTQTVHLVQAENPVYQSIPKDADQSIAQGRNAARSIVRQAFGEQIIQPERVVFPEGLVTVPPDEPGAPPPP